MPGGVRPRPGTSRRHQTKARAGPRPRGLSQLLSMMPFCQCFARRVKRSSRSLEVQTHEQCHVRRRRCLVARGCQQRLNDQAEFSGRTVAALARARAGQFAGPTSGPGTSRRHRRKTRDGSHPRGQHQLLSMMSFCQCFARRVNAQSRRDCRSGAPPSRASRRRRRCSSSADAR